MISIYWPRKKVPVWLEKIEVTGNSKPWRAYHNGFGVIAKRRGEFLVWCAAGTFIKINGGGGDVKIQGGGRGVHSYFRFAPWWKKVSRGLG